MRSTALFVRSTRKSAWKSPREEKLRLLGLEGRVRIFNPTA
jgi:hypothetical protein